MTAQGFCLASGTPALSPVSWTSRTQFCEAAHVGGGCGAGSVCVPKAARHCAAISGTATCPTGYEAEGTGAWYEGVGDTRACGACSCGAPVGGSCGTSSVHAYSPSTSCVGSFATLLAGAQTCYVGGLQSAVVALSGTSNGTCAPTVEQSGSATPTNAETICCVP